MAESEAQKAARELNEALAKDLKDAEEEAKKKEGK